MMIKVTPNSECVQETEKKAEVTKEVEVGERVLLIKNGKSLPSLRHTQKGSVLLCSGTDRALPFLGSSFLPFWDSMATC